MSAKYIIRLDDASEFMDFNKWNPFFEILDKFNVKPIIAVIPFNKDPKLAVRSCDIEFWNKVRHWQQKEYRIALHGYEHLYSNSNPGIIGMNKYSEFAGVSLEKQSEMLLKAYRKFEDEGINTEIFVAPAHSFDKNTLISLRMVTNIKYISDGFFLNPVIKYNLKWIPQQLWSPKKKLRGVWTICYHPESSDVNLLNLLDLFLKNNSSYVIDPFTLDFNKIKCEDFLYSHYMGFYMKLRSFRYHFDRFYRINLRHQK
jgi:hypothetical protein